MKKVENGLTSSIYVDIQNTSNLFIILKENIWKTEMEVREKYQNGS
jgi:hypothetical protein